MLCFVGLHSGVPQNQGQLPGGARAGGPAGLAEEGDGVSAGGFMCAERAEVVCRLSGAVSLNGNSD